MVYNSTITGAKTEEELSLQAKYQKLKKKVILLFYTKTRLTFKCKCFYETLKRRIVFFLETLLKSPIPLYFTEKGTPRIEIAQGGD